jgi:hypothetical protein
MRLTTLLILSVTFPLWAACQKSGTVSHDVDTQDGMSCDERIRHELIDAHASLNRAFRSARDRSTFLPSKQARDELQKISEVSSRMSSLMSELIPDQYMVPDSSSCWGYPNECRPQESR